MIGNDLHDFLQTSFRTVWAIELLALLLADPARGWLREDLARELRGNDLVVSQSLDALAAAGLVAVEADGRVRYLPASADLDRLAREALAAYRERPVTVRRAILSSPQGALKSFSDAFRLRKDEP